MGCGPSAFDRHRKRGYPHNTREIIQQNHYYDDDPRMNMQHRSSPMMQQQQQHTRTIVNEPPRNTNVVQEVITRRSPPPTSRMVQEYSRHGPQTVTHYTDYDDRPMRASPSSPRGQVTTTRYYEDRNPASWYKRERSAQREKMNNVIDKRQRHKNVVSSLYRDGTNVVDPDYRSSWTRKY